MVETTVKGGKNRALELDLKFPAQSPGPGI